MVPKVWRWRPLEPPLVQILVLVANIQMKTLKTEVEKGFTWSLMRREWPSPKRSLKWFERVFIHIAWKGNRLIFLWYCHDVLRWRSRTRWHRWGPWKEFSFLFNKNVWQRNGLIPRGCYTFGKAADFFSCPVRSRRSLKSLGIICISTVAVLITASGLQGE